MPTDFRDGKTFPRRGRLPLGRFLWLARAIDKGRASAAGTIHDYIYPCPMDRGMMERWGVTPEEFAEALERHDNDAGVLRWMESKVSSEQVDCANSWLSVKRFESLNRQDHEEDAFD